MQRMAFMVAVAQTEDALGAPPGQLTRVFERSRAKSKSANGVAVFNARSLRGNRHVRA